MFKDRPLDTIRRIVGKAALASICFLCAGAGAAQACQGVDSVCETVDGTYRIVLPDVAEAPSVLLLHGAGASGAAMMRMREVVDTITGRGYAVIAPDGLGRAGRNGGFWSFRPDDTERRNDAAFLAQVVDDAVSRHGIDPERVILAGFSNGAFLTTAIACRTPGAFAAYAPIAGGFWRPHPERCAGPVRLLQTHGWSDGTVPLEGRPLGGGRYLQGDIVEGLALFRAANACETPAPTSYAQSGPFLRRAWACTPGSALEFALHPGGHRVPEGWADLTLDWFETLPRD